MEVIGRITPPEERYSIVTQEDPVLREKSEPVSKFDKRLHRLLDRLANTMYHERGVGLAAVQVGILKQIIVADYGEGLIEFINPELVVFDGSELGYEGCLSVPGYFGEVERPTHIRLRAQDRQGDPFWVDLEGWPGRVLCHEMEHLQGGLFVDKSERVLSLPPEQKLRLVLMGTPEFSLPAFRSLLDHNYKVVGVVTAPDRRRGRGQKRVASPVKKLALNHDLPVLQPAGSSDYQEWWQYMKWLEPDVVVTAAYGRLIPKEILEVPAIGSLNIHPSLLPKYRGAAPIQHQLLAGETKSGISIYWMDEKLDSGPILLQEEVDIELGETYGQLHDRLAQLGAQSLFEALRLIAQGKAPAVKQDHEQATLAPKIEKKAAKIDWSASAGYIERQIRAFNPIPGAFTFWRGQRMKILKADCLDATFGQAGEVVSLSEDAMTVACGTGQLAVRVVQLAGGTPQDVGAFINGHDIHVGERLGEGDGE